LRRALPRALQPGGPTRCPGVARLVRTPRSSGVDWVCLRARPWGTLVTARVTGAQRDVAPSADGVSPSARSLDRGVSEGGNPLSRVSAAAPGPRTETARLGNPGSAAGGAGRSPREAGRHGDVHRGVLSACPERIS